MARRTVNLPFEGNITAVAAATTEGPNEFASSMGALGMAIRPGMTLVRLRGHVYFQPVGGPGSRQQVHAAFMIVPAGGLAVLPELHIDTVNAVWRIDVTTTGNAEEWAAGSFRQVVDSYIMESRGMRKIGRLDDELRMYVRNSGGTNVEVHFAGTARLMLE